MFFVVFILGWVLKIVFFFKLFVSIVMCKMIDIFLLMEFYWDLLFIWKMFQNVYYCMFVDKDKKVKLYGEVYNFLVVLVDGKCCYWFLDFVRGS